MNSPGKARCRRGSEGGLRSLGDGVYGASEDEESDRHFFAMLLEGIFEQIALFKHIILYHFHMKWPAYHGIPPMFRHTRIFAFFGKEKLKLQLTH